MHIILSCSTLVEDTDNMLENILEILEVNEYVLFKDRELQFLSQTGRIKWKKF